MGTEREGKAEGEVVVEDPGGYGLWRNSFNGFCWDLNR